MTVERAVTAAALALAAYQFVVLVSIAATQGLTFDGAMNLRAAEELFRSGRYGSYYDGFRFFPPEIQTGLPVQIPAGFFVHLLGKSPFAQNLANLLYLAGAAAMVFALIRRVAGIAAAFAHRFRQGARGRGGRSLRTAGRTHLDAAPRAHRAWRQ